MSMVPIKEALPISTIINDNNIVVYDWGIRCLYLYNIMPVK